MCFKIILDNFHFHFKIILDNFHFHFKIILDNFHFRQRWDGKFEFEFEPISSAF